MGNKIIPWKEKSDNEVMKDIDNSFDELMKGESKLNINYKELLKLANEDLTEYKNASFWKRLKYLFTGKIK